MSIEESLRRWAEFHSSREVNVLIGDISKEDIDLFFGPLYEFDEFNEVSSETTMPSLLKKFGFFKSNGQARKAGWGEDIPVGWSSFTIGKLKRQLHIFKI